MSNIKRLDVPLWVQSESRKTWNCAFNYWQQLMFPHLHNPNYVQNDFDDVDRNYWFFESLNNFGGLLDE
jgi:hypothetical protein